MGKTRTQEQLLDKTPSTKHLYENYEVQEVIQAYTKDLELSSLNSDLGTGTRLKEVANGTLLLTPRDINKEKTLLQVMILLIMLLENYSTIQRFKWKLMY